MRKLITTFLLIAVVGQGIASAQENDSLATAAAAAANSTKIVKTLQGAYLNSSCGNDRLGGSKMGFISADIPLAVEPATEDLYKVILANERYAYIPKEMVSDTTVAPETMEVSPTQSVMVSNEGKYDRIKIGLPVRKPYIIRENSYPRQMVIELFGTQNNSNWMTQYTDLEAVENIEVIQGHSNMTTYVINLKKATSWG